MDKSQNLIWIDLEMTGLCTRTDTIIEIATIVTTRNLEELAVGPVLAIRQADETMNGMDDWNRRQHAKSGLTERVLSSDISTRDAELTTLEFLRDWVEEGASPMCGNSICQDRRFLAREMPELERYFHYRNLDVSTVKLLAQYWAQDVADSFEKDSAHLALADIRDSIAELAWYRDRLFDKSVLAVQE